MFLLWTPGTWGEPMLTDGHFFSLSVGWLVGWCQKWPLPIDTDERGWTELYSGKRGMVRAGGSASRIIGDRGATDPGGGKRVRGGCPPAWQQPVGDARGSPWILDVQAFLALGSHSSTNVVWREPPVSDNNGDVAAGGPSKLPVSNAEMGDQTRGMRPAGVGRSSMPKPVVDLSDVRENAVGRPLSVEAPEFSPALDPRMQGTIGSVALSNAAGTIAPVDFAGLSVPVVAGMKFSVIAEVHSSAVDVVDDTSVVRANEQWSDGSGDPRRSPGMVDMPVTNLSAPEPLENSVLDEDLDGKPLEGLSVPEPLEHSVLDEDLDSRPMEGLSVPELLEHSVLDEDLDGRPMEGRSGSRPLEHSVPDVILERGSVEELCALEPLEHSVPEVAWDIRHIRGRIAMGPLEHSVVLDVIQERGSGEELSALEPLEHSVPEVASDVCHIRGRITMGLLEHSVPDLTLFGNVSPFPQRTTPDPLEHLGLPGEEDGGRRLVPLEPLEHLVLEASQDQRDASSSDRDLRVDSMSAGCPRVISDDRGVEVAPLDGRPKAAQTPREAGDAIVVGAVGLAAPWFLTGWAHEVDVEFMIDTGCQVTILAMTIFKRMCAVGQMVHSRLRPSRRRLVSADSSPLTVKGELELNVGFPGLCCDML